jgi:Tfp pilus assembly protein FimT
MLITWSLTASAQRAAKTSDNKKVVLNWNAAVANDYSHFIIERSFDNVSFSEVGLLFTGEDKLPNGNMDYTFADDVKSVRKGVLFYRISMVDMKGKVKKSAIQMVNTAEQKDQTPVVHITTNPVAKNLRIDLPAVWKDKYVSIELINKDGEIVRQTINNTTSTETFSIKDLSEGVYALKVSTGSETIIQHVVKSN